MSVKKKPLVVVTRKLPDSIETRMRELFDARLNLDDTPMSQEQLAEAVRTADVLVPTVTDEITAQLLNDPRGPHREPACHGTVSHGITSPAPVSLATRACGRRA